MRKDFADLQQSDRKETLLGVLSFCVMYGRRNRFFLSDTDDCDKIQVILFNPQGINKCYFIAQLSSISVVTETPSAGEDN